MTWDMIHPIWLLVWTGSVDCFLCLLQHTVRYWLYCCRLNIVSDSCVLRSHFLPDYLLVRCMSTKPTSGTRFKKRFRYLRPFLLELFNLVNEQNGFLSSHFSCKAHELGFTIQPTVVVSQLSCLSSGLKTGVSYSFGV